jgi:hypothetical protein
MAGVATLMVDRMDMICGFFPLLHAAVVCGGDVFTFSQIPL